MKVVDAADVVIEVLDARDPLGCRCVDVERLVRKSGADKKVILLLNKIGECVTGCCLMRPCCIWLLHISVMCPASIALPILQALCAESSCSGRHCGRLPAALL